MRHPTFFSLSPLFLPHRMSRGSSQKSRVVFYSLPFQYRMSTLRPSLFVCVHAGSSDCAFPVTLARVGCFDKQTLSVAAAACTNSREALERSDSKCLGTVVVFQSPCSPAVNTPPHTPAPPLLVKFCVILAAPELLRMLQLRRFNTLPAPARTKLAHAHSVSRLIKTCADLSH